MPERIDHVAEALVHVDDVHNWQSDEGITEATLIASALIAQAEATLALVEQQRIANLLALAQFSHETGDGARLHTSLVGSHEMRTEAAAALGVML